MDFSRNVTGSTYALPTLPPQFQRGMTAMVVCSGLSLFATSTLLSFLAYKAIKNYRASRNSASGAGAMQGTNSFHTQGYFWLMNLFVADFIQALGLVTVAHSLVKNSVHSGSLCTMQGFLINSGDVASAIWSFIIALHTFVLLTGGRKWGPWVAEKSTTGLFRWILCLGVWLFVIFIGTIGFAVEKTHPYRGPFYDQAGAGWCWIGQDYYWERIFFHYVFIFIDMFALTILYCILFFYIRNQIQNLRKAVSSSELQSDNHDVSTWQATLEAGNSEQPADPRGIITTTTVFVTAEDTPARRHRSALDTQTERAYKRLKQVALRLLSYPIAYICLTMPLSITRLSQFAGKDWGLKCVYAGACIFCCTGFVNVLLYTVTRKGIISWSGLFKRRKSSSSSGPEIRVKSKSTYSSHFPGSHHGRTTSQSTVLASRSISSKPSSASMDKGPLPPLPSDVFKMVDHHDKEPELQFPDVEEHSRYSEDKL